MLSHYDLDKQELFLQNDKHFWKFLLAEREGKTDRKTEKRESGFNSSYF